ncbi:4'-phosphopantetheinyl transferase superfamily protein [Mycoplasmopsis cricetuli]|uniref:4'-phosphopantetheinyl transferase superfamily protein n=1 Tax=Mycoplasmopsis cricetuli TaxID=171283 RepID=UPI0004720C79|nr:4'-phosphopantetheinyl transferase superfamily protein [Mycoplasmopsis cricetuli]
MFNIGVDITQISRFHNKKITFAQKILGKKELLEYQNLTCKDQALFLARAWAIKEAIYKADNSYSNYHKIDLVKSNNKWTFENFNISISHENDLLVAFVIKNI